MKGILLSCVVALLFARVHGQAFERLRDERDGREYKIVKIGNQWWMAENLNYYVKDGSLCYDHDEANAAIFGRLYDWNTAANACPCGWHLPSHQEWRYLEMELGFRQNEPPIGNNMYGHDEGGKLKEAGFAHWQEPNAGASDATGFAALPGGHFAMNQFWAIHKAGHFWAGEKDPANAWYRSLTYNDPAIHIFYQEKSGGYKSVRCVKDSIDLSGDYMGQTKPGALPRPFGSGVISVFDSNEHTCSISPDGNEIFFTRDPDRKIFAVQFKNREWTKPQPAHWQGREAIFSPDGSKLLFGDGDIWLAKKEGGEWGVPQKFSPAINTESYEFYASMTCDGTVYFSRLGNNHPAIFVSEFRDGRYRTAEKLPAPINSDSENNFHPFISPRGDYLLFNSDRAGGFGATDLYVSFKDARGHWEKPINLGEKINSTVRDICPTLSPDGKYLFFTRNWEENGKWFGDIYWVTADFMKRK